jgi:hypothetical protein
MELVYWFLVGLFVVAVGLYVAVAAVLYWREIHKP